MNLEERLPTISPLPPFMSTLREGYNITDQPASTMKEKTFTGLFPWLN